MTGNPCSAKSNKPKINSIKVGGSLNRVFRGFMLYSTQEFMFFII